MNKNVKLDKQKECATATIRALSHDGRGIATINNKTTFVRETLPNETITCKVIQKHSHYNEAEALEIITVSKERVVPPCTHFGVCGGCSLQHMSMASQIQLKQQTLLDQLKHFGHIVPEEMIPPLNANTIGYRRKARLGVKFVFKKNKVLVGFREKSSRYLADIESCVVLHPTVGTRFTELKELIASLEAYQHIPQIEIAVGDSDAALIFRHLEELSSRDKDKLIVFGKRYQFHIYLQPNPPALVYPLWPTDSHQHLTYTLPDHQLEFLFHPLDFTQINLEINRLMVNQAIALLDLKANETVLDLFCGMGNFTLPIARHAHRVIGIEGSQEMVTRAKENAAYNGIRNVHFHTADLMAPQPDAPWVKCQYDKILLDPPRTGAKEILPLLKSFNAKKIIYVSCNPATLARDAGEIVHQYGYHLKKAGMMNMFPHTAHIEAIAVFDKL